MASAGAVRGAVYINPRVTYEVVEGLTAMLGYLHATSDGPYTDPFQSGLQGGTSVGPRGNLMARTLGDEIDLGLDYGLTHSCYDPDLNGRPCGRCDSCVLRAAGFAQQNLTDPLTRR